MFPQHMYKVRPTKAQQKVKEPGMAADCQWQRGEDWRRNSNKWGSQGWEGSNPPSPGVNQQPPAIPAPPSEPQDNLARKTSSPARVTENEASIASPVQSMTAEDSSPYRTRTRVRSQPNEEEKSRERMASEGSLPPRRSRCRPTEDSSSMNSGPEESLPPAYVRTRSRSRQTEAPPPDTTSRPTENDLDSTAERMSRRRRTEESPAEAEPEAPPGSSFRRKSRSRNMEEPKPSDKPQVNGSSSFDPTRTRSRSRQGNDAVAEQMAPPDDVTLTLPARRRVRSIPNENETEKVEERNKEKEDKEETRPARRRVRGLPSEPEFEKTSLSPVRARRRFPMPEEESSMPPLPPSRTQSSPSPASSSDRTLAPKTKLGQSNDRISRTPSPTTGAERPSSHSPRENETSIDSEPAPSNARDQLPSVTSNHVEDSVPIMVEPPTPVDDQDRKFPGVRDEPEFPAGANGQEDSWKQEDPSTEKSEEDVPASPEVHTGGGMCSCPDCVSPVPVKEEEDEREPEEDKMIVEQTIDEDEEDEEDEIAKATRLWLQSQGPDDPELLEKVLPVIENKERFKVPTPTKDWWDPQKEEDEQQKENVEPPKRFDDWEDEPADEEPPNFTSFTSIKLRKTSPKSTPVRSRKGPSVAKENDGAPPPPPPPPPSKSTSGPPPPPPPPKANLTEKDKRVQKARERMVDQIKKATRTRPDWKTVMKDIEGGIKLRKVSSSDKLDRSKPILPKNRGKGGKFFYDSEKPVIQNQLLGEIHRGVKLRHVRTNDRSKPDFNRLGLKKLRRQLTVEEKKVIKPDAIELLPSSSDEEEDIDRMRDDLSATKSQLAEEIKNKKKLETEHKILKIDLESLQAEVKKMKRRLKEAGVQEVKPLANGEADAIGPKLSKSMSKLRMREDEMDFSELDVIEEDIKVLNDQIEAQRKRAETAEQKCDELGQKLQVSQASSDEWELRSVYFEKKYKNLQKDQGIELPDINCIGIQTDPVELVPLRSDSSSGNLAKKSSSRKSFTSSFHRMQSFKEEDESDESSSSSEEDTLSDHPGGDEDEDEEEEDMEEDEEEHSDENAKQEERDFIMLKNKLAHMKDKNRNVRKERNNLRERIKKYYKDMQNERREYLKLKAELKELSDQMKECEEEEDEEEDEDVEEEEEEDSQEEEDSENGPQKPKKLKKITKNTTKSDDDEEEEIVDLAGLEDPHWSSSEAEDSDSEEEDDDPAKQLKHLKDRIKKFEESNNQKKKESLHLKVEIDRCDEMYEEERRRHARLENELHMLLADI